MQVNQPLLYQALVASSADAPSLPTSRPASKRMHTLVPSPGQCIASSFALCDSPPLLPASATAAQKEASSMPEPSAKYDTTRSAAGAQPAHVLVLCPTSQCGCVRGGEAHSRAGGLGRPWVHVARGRAASLFDHLTPRLTPHLRMKSEKKCDFVGRDGER